MGPVAKKKTTKKNTPKKKVVAKKAAKKVVAKKPAKKVVAKKATKKVVAKKATKKVTATKVKNKKHPPIEKLETKIPAATGCCCCDDSECETEIIDNEEVPLDELEESEEGFVAAEPSVREFSADDEDEEEEEGKYGYGWGYNDAFDGESEEDREEFVDEDERYAEGSEEEEN